jgi:uncharacterized protein YjbI with pentapeptide repeats
MSSADWIKAGIDLLQAIVSGLVVALVIFGLDERRAKRDRRLSDYRIASSWETLKPKVSLRSFDLTASNLSGHNFSKANFERAIFRKAYLRATIFKGANLRMTDFSSAEVAATDFTNAVVFYSDFSKATIRSRSDEVKMELPNFTKAHFQGVNFRKANISNAKFHCTILTDADFSSAVIKNCDFTGSNLTNSKWKNVKLVENCVWKDVIVDNLDKFPYNLRDEIKKQNFPASKKKKNGK